MWTFLQALFSNPRATGAVFPSSKYLAQKMASCIDRSKSGFVLELGPGTGAITKAIISIGVPDNKLIALELAPHFAFQLKEQFPNITVIKGDAMYMFELLKNQQPIYTIISSLPLRSLSKKDRDIIFSQIPKVLLPGGQFIQFSYSLKKESDFYPKNFKITNSFLVLRNIPPARVSVFQVV